MFEKGTILKPKKDYSGFERLEVMGCDENQYKCRIVNGTAFIKKHVVESNYEEVLPKK